MSPRLIQCTPEAPWSCTFTCRRCGHQAHSVGPHPSSNHRAIQAEASAHTCPEE